MSGEKCRCDNGLRCSEPALSCNRLIYPAGLFVRGSRPESAAYQVVGFGEWISAGGEEKREATEGWMRRQVLLIRRVRDKGAGCAVYITLSLMKPTLSLRIDNEPRMLAGFAVPEMSLSSSRGSMKRHLFVFSVESDALVSYLEPAYSAWVMESKEDDKRCGGPQDELAEAGYPALRQLLEIPSLSELVVGNYLLQDFLGKLTWDGSSPIEYWLDRVTECRCDDGLVRISGTCCSRLSTQ